MTEFEIPGSLKDSVRGHSHIFNIFPYKGERDTDLQNLYK